MAESARAQAQYQSSSPPPHSSPPTVDDLALQTCDDADSLNEVMRAYAALEKLVDTGVVSDSEELAPTRSELSALLRLLNEALASRISTVNDVAGTLRVALQAEADSPLTRKRAPI